MTNWRIGVLSCLALFACSSSTKTVKSDPLNVLSLSSTIAPGAECAAGGTRVSAGPDANGNGALDAEEVTSNTVVCLALVNATLTRTRVATVAECADGGTVVEAGRDLDNDSVLADAEVVTASVVCGTVDEIEVLTVREAPGACVAGGTRTHIGRDLNGNGTLDSAEFETSVVVCRAERVLVGDVIISVQADADALAAVTTIDGSLTINPAATISLQPLQDLVEVRDNLSIDSAAQTNLVGLDSLFTVLGTFSVTGASFSSISSLRMLKSVTGSVTLNGLPLLASLDGLQGLTTVQGDLTLRDLALVASLAPLSSITSIGGELRVADLPEITSIDGFQSLTSLGSDLNLKNNDKLTSVAGFAPLAAAQPTLTGTLNIKYHAVLSNLAGLQFTTLENQLDIYDNPMLTSLSPLSSLTSVGQIILGQGTFTSLNGLQNITTVTGSISIVDNDSLTDVSALNTLTNVGPANGGSVQIVDNAALSVCAGTALENVLDGRGWNGALTNSGNLPCATSCAGSVCN